MEEVIFSPPFFFFLPPFSWMMVPRDDGVEVELETFVSNEKPRPARMFHWLDCVVRRVLIPSLENQPSLA